MSAASGLIAAVVILSAIVPLRIRYYWKILLSLPVLAAAFKFKVLHLLGGPNYFAPTLPGWVIIGFACLYAVVLFHFILLSLFEIVHWTVWCVLYFRKKLPERTVQRTLCNRIRLGLLGGAVILAAFGLYNGLKMPAVKEQRVVIPGLPAEAEGLRVAFLADIHVDSYTRAPRIRALTETVNALTPDLILLGGDYVDGSVERCGEDVAPLKELNAKYGVYAVAGNHEYFSGYGEWIPFLRSLGMRMLLNEGEQLPCGIYLAGVTDPAAKRRNMEEPSVEKALTGHDGKSPVLLVSHQPRIAPDAAKHGVAMQVSGHTHGGMIYGLDFLVKKFNGGFVDGWYDVDGMQLYVMNGTGIWNGFPVRFGHDPEITLFTLVSGK